MDSLKLDAEIQAEKALSLPAFDRVNLLGIRRQLVVLLSLIGRDGIFDEYTRHDISHIDSLLESLNWIVPDKSKKKMTPADWLMAVLAIYFHDLGMLVTKNEFEARNESGFPHYRDHTLFAGEDGTDYKARIGGLPLEEADRFLYQEFVRHHHAERIKNWIMGKAPERLGVTHAAMTEVHGLLSPLSEPFRRDLGLVCESHHRDDLADLKKYRPSQPYGSSEAETANIQYAAILLRSVDVLHMTSDRTPSVAFKTINPKDPISQREWAKQRGVTTVRPKIGTDKDGKPDPAAPRSTIEVFAYFTNPEGFFGLTSFLKYVQAELRKCSEWCRQAQQLHGAPHDFPWRNIDESNVEAQGFLPQSFEFTLDQARILDLLTGHTLYNDPSVTLRELVQNSLDAIRLQEVIDHRAGLEIKKGRVEISWNSGERRLTVRDNGTGMTQHMIERHLLRVGASRYQDPEFKREYPQFSAISRFGIGILSCFMISDNVEICTCHPDEAQTRFMNLRSVHGKYLVRLVDKFSQDVPDLIRPHGTSITLFLRPSARLSSVLDIARMWVVLPRCEVTVSMDQDPPVRIGYESARQALETFVRGASGATLEGDGEDSPQTRYRVDQMEANGFSVAYLLKWNDHYKVWSFSGLPAQEGNAPPITGTCVEGIGVTFAPPGFDGGAHIAALLNATGPDAPRTNVARTAIEVTPERNSMLRAVYRVLCKHVKGEFAEMKDKRGRSLTWATQEARYLADALALGQATSRDLVEEEIAELPVLLVETRGERAAFSIRELRDAKQFWTVHSTLLQSGEYLIREAGSNASLSGLLDALKVSEMRLPAEPLVSEMSAKTWAADRSFEKKEVDKVIINRDQRRLDLRWASQEGRWLNFAQHVWAHLSEKDRQAFQLTLQRFFQEQRMDLSTLHRTFVGAKKEIEIVGRSNEGLIRANQKYFVLPGTGLSDCLCEYFRDCERDMSAPHAVRLAAAVSVITGLAKFAPGPAPERLQHQLTERFGPLINAAGKPETFAALLADPPVLFDPSSWGKERWMEAVS
jgi:molecular chaperone HtpG